MMTTNRLLFWLGLLFLIIPSPVFGADASPVKVFKIFQDAITEAG